MTSEFQTTVTGPGTIKFYYKKNAGTNDYFRFKVDGDIKLPIANSSASWTYYPYNVTGAGSHTIQWHYSKGGSGTTANGASGWTWWNGIRTTIRIRP